MYGKVGVEEKVVRFPDPESGNLTREKGIEGRTLFVGWMWGKPGSTKSQPKQIMKVDNIDFLTLLLPDLTHLSENLISEPLC